MEAVLNNLKKIPVWQRSPPQQEPQDEAPVLYSRIAMRSEDDDVAVAAATTANSNTGCQPEQEQQMQREQQQQEQQQDQQPQQPQQQQAGAGCDMGADLLGLESEVRHMRITQGGNASSSGGYSSGSQKASVWHESLRQLGLTPEDLQREHPPTPESVRAHQQQAGASPASTLPPHAGSAAAPLPHMAATGAAAAAAAAACSQPVATVQPPAQQPQPQPGDAASAASAAADGAAAAEVADGGSIEASIAAALAAPISGGPREEAEREQEEGRSTLSRQSSTDQDAPKKELTIYAVPLYKDRLVFLPVSSWKKPPAPAQSKEGIQGVITKHVAGATQQVTDTWQNMKNSAPGSLKNKVYQLGQRILEDISPEERLMRNIPKEVDKIIIYHPSTITPDAIMDILSGMTQGYGLQAAGKAAVAGLMLPIAMGIDLIVLPGPQVLTYYTLWELYRNTNGTIGNQRLTKMVQQKAEKSVRINYIPEFRLDKYVVLSHDAPEQVLREEEIELLCWELSEPDLLQPLLELRRRELRKRVGKAGVDYSRVRGTEN